MTPLATPLATIPFIYSKHRALIPSNFAIFLVFLRLKGWAFQNKQVAVWQLGFQANKVLGTFEKQTLVFNQLSYDANLELVIMRVDYNPVDDGYRSVYMMWIHEYIFFSMAILATLYCSAKNCEDHSPAVQMHDVWCMVDLRKVLKPLGTVSSDQDQPRPVNNIFFSWEWRQRLVKHLLMYVHHKTANQDIISARLKLCLPSLCFCFCFEKHSSLTFNCVFCSLG